MKWAGYVVCMGKMRNDCKILLETPGHAWEAYYYNEP
jgi:hypothetical protein